MRSLIAPVSVALVCLLATMSPAAEMGGYAFAPDASAAGSACGMGATCGPEFDACGDSCFAGGYGDCCPATWTVHADALFLTRSDAKSQTLVTDGSEEVMNTSDFDFGYQTGLDFQLIHHTCYGWDVEAAFMMVDWWQDSRTVTGTGLSADGAWNGGFGGGDEVVGRYGSSLYSTEVNLRRPMAGGIITPLIGFRWIDLHDEFMLDMTQTSGSYVPGIVSATNVDNHLYGLQIGGDFVIVDTCKFRVETLLKAGIYGNVADQRTYSTNQGIGVVGAAEANKTTTAFAGDVKLTGEYKITDGVSLRAGYQVMWLEGVALAPEQWDNTDLTGGTATLDDEGSPLYHGAFAGVEIRR